jgi:hypothetical protein
MYLPTYLPTYLLTCRSVCLSAWSRVTSKKANSSSSSQKIPRIVRTRRFITAFKRARALYHGGSYLRVLNITLRKDWLNIKRQKKQGTETKPRSNIGQELSAHKLLTETDCTIQYYAIQVHVSKYSRFPWQQY